MGAGLLCSLSHMYEEISRENERLISITEPAEVRLFIDKYLKDAGHQDTGLTRNFIISLIANYAGKAPVKRVHLKEFVDRHIEIQVKLGRV